MPEERATVTDSESNRRVTGRQKMLKSAKIVFNKRQSVFDCFVRDLSSTGAKLTVGDVFAIPKRFTLTFHDGTAYECERVRIHGLEIGVRFVT